MAKSLTNSFCLTELQTMIEKDEEYLKEVFLIMWC